MKLMGSKGFTLVELMISLVIGLLVIAGVLQVFLMVKRTFNQLEVLSSRQEVIRFVSDSIASDVRNSRSLLLTPIEDEGEVIDVIGASGEDGAACDLEFAFGEDKAAWPPEKSYLWMSYVDASGETVRKSDPYCGTVLRGLKEVAYFSSRLDDEGSRVYMCYLCVDADGQGDPVLSVVQDGLFVGFDDVDMSSVGVYISMVFDDPLRYGSVVENEGNRGFGFYSVNRTMALP